MSVLVTGAAGFIGRHLVRRLLEDGHQVVGVDNFATSQRADLSELLDLEHFRFVELDVCQRDDLMALATREHVEAIYHLACPTGVHNLVPMALEMLATCYEGTQAVLEIARALDAPVLVTSSAEVYGNPEVSPQSETYTGNVDPLGPRKGYEEGKRVAETLCGIYAERYGVRAHIVRVFNTYGPGMSLAETRVVPAFVRAAISGEPITMHGDGSQTRSHTYVSDLVDGLRRVMARGKPGYPYNLGSERQETVAALADLVVTATDSSSEIRRTHRPAHDHDQRLPDVSRAAEDLDWAATVPLEQGLVATAEDFRRRLSARLVAARN
jgi:nucleoside-diphosphate-sugar epimerase